MAFCLALIMTVCAVGPAHAGEPTPIPVVLVPEMGACPESEWGQGRGSLLERLRRQGTGLALMDLQGRGADYVVLAGELGRLIHDTAARSGADQVDVVAHGSGALVARAAGMDRGVSDAIRQVILISPPNQGFDWVRLWGREMLLHQLERMRRGEGRFRRDGTPKWNRPEVDDLMEYVYWRSYYLYEPLYADYVWRERLVLAPPSPPPSTFESWVKAVHPDRFQSLFRDGTDLGPEHLAETRLPRPMEVLSSSYVELLSLKAGRYLYRRLVPAREALLDGWEQDLVPADTWQETVARFLLGRGARLLAQVGWPWIAFQVRGPVMDSFKAATGWDQLEPWPALTPESLSCPAGSGGDRIIANLYLQQFNAREARFRREQPESIPRQVVVTRDSGQQTGLLQALPLKAQGKECVVFLGPGDEIRVLPHGGLLGSSKKDVVRTVVELLAYPQASTPSYPWSGEITSVRPTMLAWQEEEGPLIRADQLPPGYLLAAWRGEAGRGRAVYLGEGEEIASPGSGELGLQLVVDSARPPSWEEVLAPPTASVRVTAHRGDPPSPGDDRQAGSGDSHPAQLPGGEGELEAGDSPLITAVRTSRMTTTKRERRIVHERWVWSWNGGEWIDPAEGAPVSRLDLPAEEPLEVRARSYANDERILRDLTWEVSPGQKDLPDGVRLEGEAEARWIFEAESIVEPRVLIDIEGPDSWVKGREAVFQVNADIEMPENAENLSVYYYPGEVFRVLWERPGTFTVRAAVNLRFSYRFPERSVYVSVIYTEEKEVEVMATSVNR